MHCGLDAKREVLRKRAEAKRGPRDRQRQPLHPDKCCSSDSHTTCSFRIASLGQRGEAFNWANPDLVLSRKLRQDEGIAYEQEALPHSSRRGRGCARAARLSAAIFPWSLREHASNGASP